MPSAYYICDTFLFLDALFHKKLFKPDITKQQTRTSLAAEEAVKVKRCLGALRYLWRNAKSKAHDPKVQELKSHVCPSPLQDARRGLPPAGDEGSDEDHEGEEEVSDGEEVSENEVCEEVSENEVCEEVSENDGEEVSDEVSDVEEVEVSETVHVSNAGTGKTSAWVCDGDSEVGEGDHGSEEDAGLEQPASDSESDRSVVEACDKGAGSQMDACEKGSQNEALNLDLSQQSSEQSAEDLYPDSQVSSGWLGKVYAEYGSKACVGHGNSGTSEVFGKVGACESMLADIRKELGLLGDDNPTRQLALI